MIGAIICIVICVLSLVFAFINARAVDDSFVIPALATAGISFLGIFLFALLPAWLAIIVILFLVCKVAFPE